MKEQRIICYRTHHVIELAGVKVALRAHEQERKLALHLGQDAPGPLRLLGRVRISRRQAVTVGSRKALDGRNRYQVVDVVQEAVGLERGWAVLGSDVRTGLDVTIFGQNDHLVCKELLEKGLKQA